MSANGKSTWMEVGVIILILGCGIGIPAYGFAGGSGEPNNPYQIATAADLVAMGLDNSLSDKHFVLIHDIDLDPNLPGGRVFTDALISSDANIKPDDISNGIFIGVLDGQGHTIHHLCVSGQRGSDSSSAGLFGEFDGLVKDLHLKDVRIDGSTCGAFAGHSSVGTLLRCSVTGKVAGSNCVGGLVGVGVNLTLLHCESRADVAGDPNSIVGGLVGSTFMSGQVMECRAAGTVTGGMWAGGLIGDSQETMILRCVAVCQVKTEETAGGLIGFGPAGGSVADCYARGSIAGVVVGGLIGDIEMSGPDESRILDSYAAFAVLPRPSGGEALIGNGLCGRKLYSWGPWHVLPVLGCFWDKELPKVHFAPGPYPANFGTGLTTQQMQQQATFKQTGWDFGSTWAMPESGYPVLRWELTADAGQQPQN
jgi:hypothetical protein